MAEQPKPTDATKPRPRKIIMKQKMMMRVIYALLPVLAVATYFFGWRALALTALVTAVGFGTEYVTTRQRKTPVTTALFVTCLIYALSLPPTTPYWIAVVGIIISVLFGKEVYGGFGRNFVNPAMTGRLFVFLSFPVELAAGYEPAYRNWPGGLVHWSMTELPDYLAGNGLSMADAISSATPMFARQNFGYETPLRQLLVGDIGGIFTVSGEQAPRVLTAGCLGETSAAILIVAGVYLLVTKTANWRLMLGTIVGAVLANVVFRPFAGEAMPPVAFTMLSGAMMYGTVFIVTDPVSAPKQKLAQYVYAGVIGVFVVAMRWRASFSGAWALAVITGNILAPTLDIAADALKRRFTPPAPPPKGAK